VSLVLEAEGEDGGGDPFETARVILPGAGGVFADRRDWVIHDVDAGLTWLVAACVSNDKPYTDAVAACTSAAADADAAAAQSSPHRAPATPRPLSPRPLDRDSPVMGTAAAAARVMTPPSRGSRTGSLDEWRAMMLGDEDDEDETQPGDDDDDDDDDDEDGGDGRSSSPLPRAARRDGDGKGSRSENDGLFVVSLRSFTFRQRLTAAAAAAAAAAEEAAAGGAAQQSRRYSQADGPIRGNGADAYARGASARRRTCARSASLLEGLRDNRGRGTAARTGDGSGTSADGECVGLEQPTEHDQVAQAVVEAEEVEARDAGARAWLSGAGAPHMVPWSARGGGTVAVAARGGSSHAGAQARRDEDDVEEASFLYWALLDGVRLCVTVQARDALFELGAAWIDIAMPLASASDGGVGTGLGPSGADSGTSAVAGSNIQDSSSPRGSLRVPTAQRRPSWGLARSSVGDGALAPLFLLEVVGAQAMIRHNQFDSAVAMMQTTRTKHAAASVPADALPSPASAASALDGGCLVVGITYAAVRIFADDPLPERQARLRLTGSVQACQLLTAPTDIDMGAGLTWAPQFDSFRHQERRLKRHDERKQAGGARIGNVIGGSLLKPLSDPILSTRLAVSVVTPRVGDSEMGGSSGTASAVDGSTLGGQGSVSESGAGSSAPFVSVSLALPQLRVAISPDDVSVAAAALTRLADDKAAPWAAARRSRNEMRLALARAGIVAGKDVLTSSANRHGLSGERGAGWAWDVCGAAESSMAPSTASLTKGSAAAAAKDAALQQWHRRRKLAWRLEGQRWLRAHIAHVRRSDTSAAASDSPRQSPARPRRGSGGGGGDTHPPLADLDGFELFDDNAPQDLPTPREVELELDPRSGRYAKAAQRFAFLGIAPAASAAPRGAGLPGANAGGKSAGVGMCLLLLELLEQQLSGSVQLGLATEALRALSSAAAKCASSDSKQPSSSSSGGLGGIGSGSSVAEGSGAPSIDTRSANQVPSGSFPSPLGAAGSGAGGAVPQLRIAVDVQSISLQLVGSVTVGAGANAMLADSGIDSGGFAGRPLLEVAFTPWCFDNGTDGASVGAESQARARPALQLEIEVLGNGAARGGLHAAHFRAANLLPRAHYKNLLEPNCQNMGAVDQPTAGAKSSKGGSGGGGSSSSNSKTPYRGHTTLAPRRRGSGDARVDKPGKSSRFFGSKPSGGDEAGDAEERRRRNFWDHRSAMLIVDLETTAPVGGITVVKHLEFRVCPLSVALTHELIAALVTFGTATADALATLNASSKDVSDAKLSEGSAVRNMWGAADDTGGAQAGEAALGGLRKKWGRLLRTGGPSGKKVPKSSSADRAAEDARSGFLRPKTKARPVGAKAVSAVGRGVRAAVRSVGSGVSAVAASATAAATRQGIGAAAGEGHSEAADEADHLPDHGTCEEEETLSPEEGGSEGEDSDGGGLDSVDGGMASSARELAELLGRDGVLLASAPSAYALPQASQQTKGKHGAAGAGAATTAAATAAIAAATTASSFADDILTMAQVHSPA
jgi:hypothetical protein